MFTKIKTWITGEVRSVESILSSFRSTISQLEQHAEATYAKAVHLDQVVIEHYSKAIEAAQANIDVAHAEVAKAKDVASKLKALIA